MDPASSWGRFDKQVVNTHRWSHNNFDRIFNTTIGEVISTGNLRAHNAICPFPCRSQHANGKSVRGVRTDSLRHVKDKFTVGALVMSYMRIVKPYVSHII